MPTRSSIQTSALGAIIALASTLSTPALAQHPGGGPKQWWCEVYAQPASGSGFTREEASQGFFFSQIITRPRPRRDEEEQLERRCRASFEVQFGGRWTLVTARAYSAATVDAATSMRTGDMNEPTRRGHTQEFRLTE